MGRMETIRLLERFGIPAGNDETAREVDRKSVV